jgi:hypothetical protein
MTSLLFPAAQGSGHYKARKKQVAMIAQKVMDANQTQHEEGPFIPSSNPRTTAFRAFLSYHQSLFGPEFSGILCCAPSPGRSRDLSFSISRSIF